MRLGPNVGFAFMDARPWGAAVKVSDGPPRLLSPFHHQAPAPGSAHNKRRFQF